MVEANTEMAATGHIIELVKHLMGKKYKVNRNDLETPKGQVLADLVAAVSKCTGLERSKIEATSVKGQTDVYYEGGHLEGGVKHGLGIYHSDSSASWYGGCCEDLYWKWQVYNEGEEIHSFTIDEYHYDK